MASKKPCPKTIGLDLFGDEPAAVAIPVAPAVPAVTSAPAVEAVSPPAYVEPVYTEPAGQMVDRFTQKSGRPGPKGLYVGAKVIFRPWADEAGKPDPKSRTGVITGLRANRNYCEIRYSGNNSYSIDFGRVELHPDALPLAKYLKTLPADFYAAPTVDNSKNGLSTPEELAAYAKSMQGEMGLEVARCRFIQAMYACKRHSDIQTDNNVDLRKVNRIANGLLGRPESIKPEPTAAEWQAAYTALAESIGLSMEPEE